MTIRVTIDRLGHHGDGIARHEDATVYVRGALPGEVVEGALEGETLSAPRILEPVPERVKAPCAHARTCGGCQLQHASDEFVASWKVDVVRRALEAQGLEAEIRAPIVSPPRSRRRAGFSVRRTKKGALAGFHQKASDVLVAVPQCQLVRPALANALPMVEALGMAAASRKTPLSVQVTDTEGGLDVMVSGAKPLDLQAMADFAQDYDLARLAWGEEVLTRRPPMLRFGQTAVTPPPGAFLQATAEGEAALQGAVLEALKGASSVADLFSGCGTFALPLAEHCKVHAVESSAAMLAALDRGWRHGTGLRHVSHEARDLFRNPLLPDELDRLDGAVIDPPRAGAEAQVAQLAAARVPRIAHVSCNPVTFARDCAALVRAGYTLGPIQVVDQFRWSTHVELVAALTLKK